VAPEDQDLGLKTTSVIICIVLWIGGMAVAGRIMHRPDDFSW